MQTLRSARRLARLVLAWFALSLGVAVAAPLVKPANIELLCSGSGVVKLLVKGEPDGQPTAHTLDCPLCAGLHAPPAFPRVEVPFVAPHWQALASIPAARIAAAVAAPLPARGPPAPRLA